MIESIKDYIRTKPQLYDSFKAFKRQFVKQSDPTFDYLNTFSKSHNRKVNFVQIGANDGLRNDPIREFIIRDCWKGILIEPLPIAFNLLINNYSYIHNPDLIFVNAAVSSIDQENLTFYSFKEKYLTKLSFEEKMDMLRKASFIRKHVEAFIGDKDPDDVIQEIEVPCLKFNSLLKQYWGNKKVLDLLVIDAEGYEPDIIKSIDYTDIRPSVIFFESHHLGVEKERLFHFLEKKGYSLKEIGGDTVATSLN